MARRSVIGDGEDGWGNSKRGGDEADLDITPMIDVTFLLLIFFMVSSTMQGKPDLDVPPAKHGTGVDSGGAMIIIVKKPLGPDDPAQISLDGRGGDASIEDVKAFIQEGLGEDKDHVIIKADREVPHGFVQEVTRAVTEFEGVSFSIGVRDKD